MRAQKKQQDQLAELKRRNKVTVAKLPFSTDHKAEILARNYVNEGEPGRQGRMAEQVFGDDKVRATLASKQMGQNATAATATQKDFNASKSRLSTTRGPKKQPSSNRTAQLLQQKRREEMEA